MSGSGDSQAFQELTVKLQADLDGLKSGMTQANGLLEDLAENSKHHMKEMAGAFVIAELAVHALEHAFHLLKEATIDLVKEQLQAVDHLAKLSDRTGIATEKLAGLSVAAEENGLTLDTMTSAIQRMQRGLQEAVDNGTGPAQDGLDKLGLSARDLINLKPDEAMMKIAEAISHVGSQAERTKILVDLYGRSGIELAGIMSKGAAAFEEGQAKAEKFGLAISRVDAGQVERANIAMEDIHLAIEGAARALTIKLAPYLEVASNWIVDMANDAGGFDKNMTSAIDNISSAIGVMADILLGAERVWKAMAVAVYALSDAWTHALDFIIHGLMYVGELFDNWVEALKQTGRVIGNVFVVAFDWAKNAVVQFAKGAVQEFGDLVLGLANAMTKVGVKGASDMVTAGNDIRNSVEGWGNASQKAANLAERALSASAKKVKSDWKNVLPDWDMIDTGKIKAMADLSSAAFKKAKKELDDAWNKPWPSAGIKASIDHMIMLVKHANAAVIAAAEERKQVDKAEHDRQVSAANADLKQYKDLSNAKRIEANKDFIADQKRIKAEFEIAGTAQEERDAIMEELKRQHEVRMANIQDTYAQQQQRRVEAAAKFENSTNLEKAQFAANVLGNLASLMQTHSKRLFQIGKMAAIAEAVINTAVAVTKAYNQFGYPYGLIAGAAMAVAGAVQIAKIASSSFEGGGSVGAVSGGASGAPATAGSAGTSGATEGHPVSGVTGQGAEKQSANIIIQSGIHDSNAVRDLVDRIKSVIADGGSIGTITVSQ